MRISDWSSDVCSSDLVKVDAVADPVTVTIDTESASGDEAFAPGEAGTEKVTASIGDNVAGSEVQTVTVTVKAGDEGTGLCWKRVVDGKSGSVSVSIRGRRNNKTKI